MLEFIRNIIATEPARLVGYGSSIAVFLALQVAKALGVELTLDVQAAISTLAGFVIAELIRRFVFSPDTVQTIADNSTYLEAGTTVDIGNPPEGPA